MKSWFRLLFIGINFILYLVIIATWIAIPEELTLNVSASVFNLSLTLILLYSNREDLKKYYMSSQFKNFVKSLVSAVLVFCILGFINYLAFKNPSQIDFTPTRKNSITEQSVSIVKGIKGPVTFKVFCRKSEFPAYKALLELYRLEKSDIKIEHVDIELRPDLVKSYDITVSGTIVTEYKDRKEVLTGTINELKVTNSLINVTRKEKPMVYYSIGHDELDLDKSGKQGGLALKTLLDKSSYQLTNINLKSVSEIPTNIAALVIWGPKTGFLDQEIKTIDRYLQKGGNLLVALDPNWSDDKIRDLRKLVEKWGAKVGNDMVIDRLKHVSGSTGMVPIISRYNPTHAITSEFKGDIFFPLASSIVGDEENGFVKLAWTNPFPASWAERNANEVIDGKISYTEGSDLKGPVPVVAAIDKKERGTKIVVFGNSSFVQNIYQKFSKNYVFLLNSLSWLSDEDRLISFNLPVVKDEPIFISGPQLGVIFYFSVVFAPIFLFGTAIFLYRRRIKL